VVAITINFNLYNVFTYRDRRVRGLSLLWGHLSFYLICSIGATANLQVAEMLFDHQVHWALAGALGAVVGAVWNFAVSSTLTWRKRDQTVTSRSCDGNPGNTRHEI
jgi:dolichol-phosphate mannosyltransferase